MRSFLLALLAIVVAFAAFAASDTRSGVWTAELDTDGLNVTIFQGAPPSGLPASENMMRLTVQLPKLSGLSTDAVNGSGANVKFALVRAAGVIVLRRTLRQRKGGRALRLHARAGFLRDMEQLDTQLPRRRTAPLRGEDLTPSIGPRAARDGVRATRRDLDESPSSASRPRV